MKILTVGYEGAEKVMQDEIKELINAPSKTETSVAIADVNDETLNSYSKLSYLGQSFIYVLEYLDSFDIKEFEDIQLAEKIDFSKVNKKFRVSCLRIGDQNYSSKDIEAKLGEIVVNKTKAKVNLEKFDIRVLIYIYNDKAYVGLDYAIVELDKRDYKVYSHPKSVKGPLAFTLLKLAGYKEDKVLLDSFCHSGEIVIEAAFVKSKFPINYYRKDKFGSLIDKKYLEEIDEERLKNSKKEKTKKSDKKSDRENKQSEQSKPSKNTIIAFDADLRNIKSTKQNATIGGIKEYIDLSRVDAEWIDIKLEEGSVDLIVTNPSVPHRANHSEIRKQYEEFFYNAEYVLNKKGKIYAISNAELRLAAAKKKFKLEDSMIIKKGSQILTVDIFKQS